MIRLYGVPMSRASRCLWMLEELGVPYENVPTNFVGDAQKPEYLELNPNGKVPTLVDDDGTVVWESLAINLHLARTYDRGLWPKTRAGEAHALQWSFWAATEVEPPCVQIIMNRAFLPEGQRDPKLAAAGEAALQKPLRVLDGALAGRDWLVEDRFTVADLNVHSVLAVATSFGKTDVSAHRQVSGWLARCGGRPALRRVFPR
jgi:glutathione S-transferase